MAQSPSILISDPERPPWIPVTLRGCESGSLAAVMFTGEPLGEGLDYLVSEELAFANTLAVPRRNEWIAGRICLALAYAACLPKGVPNIRPALLSSDNGAPRCPSNVVASISHKASLAVALVSTSAIGVGVDVEHVDGREHQLIDRILTKNEQCVLPRNLDINIAVCLHFALKEAAYKATTPEQQPHLEFDDFELHTDWSSCSCPGWRRGIIRARRIALCFNARWIMNGAWILATVDR